VDWKIFWTTLAIGIGFVVVQGITSHFDGYFSKAQLNSRGVVAWSFLEHGGMWADVFIISPVVAYALSKYRLDYTVYWGTGTFLFSALFTLIMVEIYRREGMKMGDHCTHDGVTTIAGWIHAAYAFIAICVMLQVFLGLTTPVVSKGDIVIFAIMLTPFFYLGVAKFSSEWAFSRQDEVQVAALTAGVWAIALTRIALT